MNNYYRPCRACGADQIHVKLVSQLFPAHVAVAQCSRCGKAVATVVYSNFTEPLRQAWNDANMPQGLNP